jgi:hypothetical protein
VAARLTESTYAFYSINNVLYSYLNSGAVILPYGDETVVMDGDQNYYTINLRPANVIVEVRFFGRLDITIRANTTNSAVFSLNGGLCGTQDYSTYYFQDGDYITNPDQAGIDSFGGSCMPFLFGKHHTHTIYRASYTGQLFLLVLNYTI